MSSYGIDTSKLHESRQKSPPVRLKSFFDLNQPWVLVPDGSLLGFFDWVPKNLRIGPWSSLAIPTLATVIGIIVRLRPNGDDYDTMISSYPDVFSKFWWYNAITFTYMLSLITFTCKMRTKAILVTFTIISWNLNMIRHGLNALIPFLSDGHFILKINHVLRFPALVSASITTSVWYIVLVPYIFFIYSKDKEKRQAFLRWNFSFRLTQIHLCNVFYAALNTIVTGSRQGPNPNAFDAEDLWYGLVLFVSYAIFYVTVLDRLGVHIYPFFSPRGKFIPIIWGATIALCYGVFHFWNYVIMHDFLEFEHLVASILAITIIMWIVHLLFPKSDSNAERKNKSM